jgi:hypothetical protein
MKKPPPPKSKVGRPNSLDPRVPYSIGLKRSEVEELGELAKEHRITRNALGALLVRLGVKLLKSGRLKLPSKG